MFVRNELLSFNQNSDYSARFLRQQTTRTNRQSKLVCCYHECPRVEIHLNLHWKYRKVNKLLDHLRLCPEVERGLGQMISKFMSGKFRKFENVSSPKYQFTLPVLIPVYPKAWTWEVEVQALFKPNLGSKWPNPASWSQRAQPEIHYRPHKREN